MSCCWGWGWGWGQQPGEVGSPGIEQTEPHDDQVSPGLTHHDVLFVCACRPCQQEMTGWNDNLAVERPPAEVSSALSERGIPSVPFLLPVARGQSGWLMKVAQ